MQLNMKPYGEDSVRWIIRHPVCGLFLDPGLGKTAISLLSFKLLKDCGEVDKLLVIAPLRVCQTVWPAEVEKWDAFSELSIVVLHGPNKDQLLKTKADIYAINPDGLDWLQSKVNMFKLNRCMLVCDESTMFKSHSSERFKIVKKKLLQFFRRRVILTATPASNGLPQLWSQVFILDQGQRLGKFITHFRNKYLKRKEYGYGYELLPDSEEKIYEAIEDIVMHKSSEVLDLPPLTYNTINVKLTDDAMAVYKQMKKDSVIEYGEGKVITAVNAGILSSKLHQIANGGVYAKDKSVYHLHSQKVAVITSLLEELAGRPLLVMYQYHQDLQRLNAVHPAPYIGADVSGAKLNKITKDWNSDKLPLLYLQPQSGAHGLNLQDGSCNAICWFSIPYDLELYQQANRRVHRQGVKNAVIVHHIVAKGTIDEHWMDVLEEKYTVEQALLNALKQ
jgi:SNF2 family DNA or RNA helicase